ncbi:TIGR03084 family metal-binding protein [Nocardioides endophyticus]|uniref:TIGR03084 family metal-binding protein n=1 Tax=Nocardioides endophyticus TaxID=1353775 RepID=A0ABP8YDB3_9ACTN
MTDASPIPGLIRDLEAERTALISFLDAQPTEVWQRSTPAQGWTVHDQIAHLAHFDEVTRMCIAEPEAFEHFRDAMDDLQTYVDSVGTRFAHLGPDGMSAWWTEAGEALSVAATAADPARRVPWFGPPMSLASKLTARIMETWAHGQDVYDAVGAQREPTERLRHIARIGVLAFPNSFRTRGLPVPSTPVRVDLEAPDGSRWAWGDPDATDVVSGPAEDFCLVVTQRRHIADVELKPDGVVAQTWMEIAQAFAGPAGSGRAPGQFAPGWVAAMGTR